MIMSTPTTDTAPTEAATFTLLDRCDACGAEAKARFDKPGRHHLMTCGHHANKYGPGFALDGWTETR